jgi:hypothetical protein
MAGSRSTVPLNRSNSVLIVAPFSLSDQETSLFSRLKDDMTFMEALDRDAENQHGHNVKANFGNQVRTKSLIHASASA